MRERRFCPICKSFESKSILSAALKTFDGSKLPLKVQVSECLGCGFVFNDDAMDEQSLNQFYTKDNFYYTEGSFGTGGSDLSRYRNYIEFLKPFLQHSNVIVDVGCGKGQLVKYMIANGFANASGVELDKRMVEIAASQGIPIHEGSAFGLTFKPDSIDLLIYTHVFEHLLDPDNVIRQANEYLKDNGLLFIETPDALKYSQARVFDLFWLTTVEHINHFSGHYLEFLLAKHGFEMIATSEVTMPYNNPSYSYPSLKMLFRKNGKRHSAPCQPEYSGHLRDEIRWHIAKENEFLAKHRQMINELNDSKTKLYIWGIGREFFILSSFTDLLNCNIQALLDKNRDKHGRSVDGINIVPPDRLKQAEANTSVLLTSVFNKLPMQDHIREISFAGSVVSID